MSDDKLAKVARDSYFDNQQEKIIYEEPFKERISMTQRILENGGIVDGEDFDLMIEDEKKGDIITHLKNITALLLDIRDLLNKKIT